MATADKSASALASSALWALWISQFLSLVGSDVAKFALRVWVYRSTASVTQYTIIAFCAEAPALVLSPLLGLAIDRLPRRTVLIVSDVLAALCTLVLFVSDSPSQTTILLMNALSSILGAVHWTAFTASATLLVPKEALVRFGAMAQFAPALSMMFSPAIAGVVVETLGLRAAFVFELATCAVAALSLLSVMLPTPDKQPPSTFVQDALAGLRFVLSTRLLRTMLLLQLCSFAVAAALQVLTLPLLLTFVDAATMGGVLTASGFGAMVGTALATAVAPYIHRAAFTVAVLQMVQGALMVVCALRASASLVLGVAFSIMLLVPTARACREAVWQSQTPPALHGRVLLLLQAFMQAMLPLSGTVLGPLADGVFEPRMLPGGAWANTLGVIVGTGPGRGCAVLMGALGVGAAAIAALCLLITPDMRTLQLSPKSKADTKGEPSTAAPGAAETDEKKAQ